MSASVTYTEEGCIDARTARDASSAFYCGPYPEGTPGRRGDDECCYFHCVTSPTCGRPFVVAGEMRVADARASGDWLGDGSRSGSEVPGGIASDSDVTREWLRDALAEHASVASFSAFNLSLLALGTPAALVRAGAAAALDEVFHAKACFELASEFGGEPVGPAPLDMGELRVDTDLASLAERAFIDGCFGETVAALVARASLDVCEAPHVRTVLERIASDEANHAELSRQFVAWALRGGGDAVARVLSSALERVTASVGATTGDHLSSQSGLRQLAPPVVDREATDLELQRRRRHSVRRRMLEHLRLLRGRVQLRDPRAYFALGCRWGWHWRLYIARRRLDHRGCLVHRRCRWRNC